MGPFLEPKAQRAQVHQIMITIISVRLWSLNSVITCTLKPGDLEPWFSDISRAFILLRDETQSSLSSNPLHSLPDLNIPEEQISKRKLRLKRLENQTQEQS